LCLCPFFKSALAAVCLQIGGTKDQLFQNGRALEGKNDFVKRFAAKIQCNPGFGTFPAIFGKLLVCNDDTEQPSTEVLIRLS
jgi:hypothetical protein